MAENRQTQNFFEKCKSDSLFPSHLKGISKKIIFDNFRGVGTEGGGATAVLIEKSAILRENAS